LKKTFYSNGKLLITGEYTVLDGAKALALPTKFGQSLSVKETDTGVIKWTSIDADGSRWLEAEMPIESITSNTTSGTSSEIDTLINILHLAYIANPQILSETKGFSIETKLTFPRQWGLGTSSTLINNVAQWFCIDAYALLANSFGGSGYDIACAQHDTAIVYSRENNISILSTSIKNKTAVKRLRHTVNDEAT
jgi:mevalonate kinase